ncbi:MULTISPECIES: acyl carrier protein [unclassified Mesorhizobium]|uniref:acyl carrier protein n=1 Tax=unclassified Mesorhizobium TaxID=325217 RepID=UPI00333DA2BE
MSSIERPVSPSGDVDAGRAGPKPAEIKDWITSYIARLLDLKPSTIGRTQTFDEIGLDSMMTIVMTEELGLWLGREIDPTSAYDHPTIERFSTHISTVQSC